jgi:hypothetical protein
VIGDWWAAAPIWWGRGPIGGERLPEDRRFYQGNRRTLTNPPGYIGKRADLSDIALVCLVSSAEGHSDVGAVTQRQTRLGALTGLALRLIG